MRTSDCDILMVPGWSGSGPEHWQTRWAAKLATAATVEQEDWYAPNLRGWSERLIGACQAASQPVVLVGHSLGAILIAHAAKSLGERAVGAFLVAPPSEKAVLAIPGMDPAFVPFPQDPLPFPSVLVASSDDPYCPFAEAEDLSYAWGSSLVDAGEAGHINGASGHGPWPEGLMRFAGFLKML